jgi:quinol monooxygenase YgiN
MVIVAGHITVEPQQRESYLAGCVSVVEQARGTAGCLDFAITADLIDPGRVNIFERWESQAALERNSQDLWIGACHALLSARRVADHADLRHRLGRGQVLGPHPGRPDSRSPTAMSFAVVSSLYPHTRSTALEESSP